MPDSPILVYIVDEGGLVTLNIVIEGDLTRIALSPRSVASLMSDLSDSNARYVSRVEHDAPRRVSARTEAASRRPLDS